MQSIQNAPAFEEAATYHKERRLEMISVQLMNYERFYFVVPMHGEFGHLDLLSCGQVSIISYSFELVFCIVLSMTLRACFSISEVFKLHGVCVLLSI